VLSAQISLALVAGGYKVHSILLKNARAVTLWLHSIQNTGSQHRLIINSHALSAYAFPRTKSTCFHIKTYLSRIKERVIVTNVEAVGLAHWAPIAILFYFSLLS
jgi:hypothetical protein